MTNINVILTGENSVPVLDPVTKEIATQFTNRSIY